MIEKFEGNYQLTIIRGATTAKDNSVKEIESAVVELIEELITRNNIVVNNLLSVTFTVTNDLDACFPASIARKAKRTLKSLKSNPQLKVEISHESQGFEWKLRLKRL